MLNELLKVADGSSRRQEIRLAILAHSTARKNLREQCWITQCPLFCFSAENLQGIMKFRWKTYSRQYFHLVRGGQKYLAGTESRRSKSSGTTRRCLSVSSTDQISFLSLRACTTGAKHSALVLSNAKREEAIQHLRKRYPSCRAPISPTPLLGEMQTYRPPEQLQNFSLL